jgi:hypothetical protein
MIIITINFQKEKVLHVLLMIIIILIWLNIII